MSNRTRAERRHNTENWVKKRVSQWDNSHSHYDVLTPKTRGRMKKHAYYDCGRARCGLCHIYSRRFKYVNKKWRVTMQERKAELYNFEWHDEMV